MRFHSTPESAQNGEITQLAIIECVVAIAIYVGIGIYSRTFRLLALAVAVAPLTLLRTDASVRWGLERYEQASNMLDRWMDLAERGSKATAAAVGVTLILVGAATGAVIRISAVPYWVLRRPLESLREMPGNWLRQSLCTDSFYPPELVPLEAVYPTGVNVVTFRRFVEVLGETRRTQGLAILSLVLVILWPFVLIGYLPSLFYRVSFKATSLAYAPFVWVAHATLRTPDSIKLRLERITKGELEKTRRWVSGMVALALITKVALVLGWIDVSAALAKFPSKKFVESLLVPNVWPWWQITLGIDALTTFCLLWYADAALPRLEGKGAWREDTIAKTVSTAAFVRASLAIVTMSHFFYVAFTTVVAGHARLPAL